MQAETSSNEIQAIWDIATQWVAFFFKWVADCLYFLEETNLFLKQYGQIQYWQSYPI